VQTVVIPFSRKRAYLCVPNTQIDMNPACPFRDCHRFVERSIASRARKARLLRRLVGLTRVSPHAAPAPVLTRDRIGLATLRRSRNARLRADGETRPAIRWPSYLRDVPSRSNGSRLATAVNTQSSMNREQA
jgi:hypothetical protein